LICRKHGKVEAVVEALADGVFEERHEDRSLTKLRDDCEQPALHGFAAGRQMGIEIGDFAVERKGPLAPDRHHAHDLAVAQHDEVGVFGVESVDQLAIRVGRVLRDLLDEGAVVEPVDLLELPRFRGDLDPKFRGRGFHGTAKWAGNAGSGGT
jgi:hypothetical protein